MEPSAFLDPLAVYLEAFAEHDPELRGELLARCLTEDAEIWGPKRVFVGYAAISEKIPGFHNNCKRLLSTVLTESVGPSSASYWSSVASTRYCSANTAVQRQTNEGAQKMEA